MRSMIMERIIALLNHECPICYEIIIDEAACSSCCISLYHKKCISSAQSYSSLCPTCSNTYCIIGGDRYLTDRQLPLDVIRTLYNRLYKENPLQLVIIDHAIRSYKGMYQGYLPLDLFTSSESNWRAHTYGIFDELLWNHIVAVGYGVTGDKIDDDSEISFVIYNTDYRVIRSTLAYLVDYIRLRLDVNVRIAIVNELVQIIIPGMAKPVTVDLRYRKDMYPGTMFYRDGVTFTSIRYLVDPIPHTKLSGWYYISYSEISDKVTMTPEDFFARNMRDYKLYVITGDSSVSRFAAEKALSEVSKIIDVIYECGPVTGASIRCAGDILYAFIGDITHDTIYEFVVSTIMTLENLKH